MGAGRSTAARDETCTVVHKEEIKLDG